MDQTPPITSDTEQIEEIVVRDPAQVLKGTEIAQLMLEDLKKRVSLLSKSRITPTLAIICVGSDTESLNYIAQKKKAAHAIGAKILEVHYPNSVLFQQLAEQIQLFNANPSVHGIVIQRPLPATISTSSFNTAVTLKKDVDGFRFKSPFEPPIALAVYQALREALGLKIITSTLKNKNVVIIGRGETAGRPIMNYFTERKVPFLSANRDTTSIGEFTKEADIIISCVGKSGVITPEVIKEDVILIGVGLHYNDHGKLSGDYNVKEIQNIARFYTPTPGGIGPMNVAYLMKNLVDSAEKSPGK